MSIHENKFCCFIYFFNLLGSFKVFERNTKQYKDNKSLSNVINILLLYNNACNVPQALIKNVTLLKFKTYSIYLSALFLSL